MYSSVIVTLLFGALLSLPVIYANSPWLGCVLTTSVTAVGSVSSRRVRVTSAQLTVPGETILMRIISGGSFLVKTATVVVKPTSLALPTTSLPAHPSPLIVWLSFKPVSSTLLPPFPTPVAMPHLVCFPP
uniref:Secreted protein n=1 Tax=Cryptococcus bacillisporus CA1280 TaxID=1296109 RepID=A0A0D0THK9_CRYGA|nr:hypothetical protein I312_04927 [Cryptococcus bacillisporus CA1280]